jgi:hypothetical protein
MTVRLSRRAALLGGAGLCRRRARRTRPTPSARPSALGGLTTLEGPFATGGQDAYRCVQMELERIESTVGGRRIEFIRESSNAQADVALARARKLIEQDNADIILGPALGCGGHRAARLFPHADRQDHRQRILGGVRHDPAQPVAELLPLLDGWHAVDGGPRQARLRDDGHPRGRGDGGRLRLPLFAGLRLQPGILPPRRQGHALLGAARHHRFRLADRADQPFLRRRHRRRAWAARTGWPS